VVYAMRADVRSVPFTLPQELEDFRESVRAFARDRLWPGYHARARSTEFPHPVVAELAQHGLCGVNAPESLGGQGADPLALGIALEQLAWGDFNVSEIAFSGALTIELLGGEPAFADVVAGVAAGRRHVALGLTEPGAGSDAANLATRAEPVDGGWRLWGEKTSISCAAHADSAIVFAQGPGAGVSAFVCELDASVGRQRFDDLGNRPVGRGSLMFDGTLVSAERRLGAPGRGFQRVRVRSVAAAAGADGGRHRPTRARADGGARRRARRLRPAADAFFKASRSRSLSTTPGSS
jgi:cyclohexanecarboxyl-CoA dehydrogenase